MGTENSGGYMDKAREMARAAAVVGALSGSPTEITLVGVGAFAISASIAYEAEAKDLKETLTPQEISEGKAIFDKISFDKAYVGHTNKSLDILNKTPDGKVRVGDFPREVVAELLKSSPNLVKCGVTNIRVGILIPESGEAKLILRLITNKKGPNGEFIFHQFSRPATKR